MTDAIRKFIFAIAGVAWSIAVTVNAYGLDIQSWNWLVWGTIGTFALLWLAGAGDSSK